MAADVRARRWRWSLRRGSSGAAGEGAKWVGIASGIVMILLGLLLISARIVAVVH